MRAILSGERHALLYRCIALTAFVCLVIVVNVFDARTLTTLISTTTTTTKIREVALPQEIITDDNSIIDTSSDQITKNRSSFHYCYNPTTFNRTQFTTQNGNDQSIQLHSQQQQDSGPKVIWLMSFPNSGTTYTLKYVQGSTGTTTATNYGGNEQVGYDTSISIDVNRYIHGPYLRYPDRPYSCQSILTKTHCHQDEVLSQNVSHFISSCRMGNRNVDGTHEEIIYDASTRVHSVIHLIRNPFDNIVARMHYKQKQWLASNSSREHELAEYITFTPEGLLHWCQYVKLTEQKHYYSHFNRTFWENYMEPVPCAIEFYKYFHWHHYTTEGVLATMHHPSMILHYEDYTTGYNTTTRRLLDFLQLKRSSYTDAPEFIVGKTYTDWFTDEMKESVKRLALVVVSDVTWNLLRRYFE